MIIGLTGSSGSGKSTVASMLQKQAYHIIDCDKISREIDNDEEYIKMIRNAFGDVVFSSGKISRRALGHIVFSDRKKLELLSSISHPIIRKKVLEDIEKHKKSSNIILDAPLLFESGLDSICDTTIGIIADDDLRTSRVMERDHLDIDEAKKRISAQQSIDFYKNKCIIIIENNGDVTALSEKLTSIINNIESKKG